MKLSSTRTSYRGAGGILPLLTLTLVLGLLLSAAPAMAGDPERTADFSLKGTDGKTYRLSDFTGKNVVVISFWNLACKPCRKEMPKLQEIYDELKDRGLMILAINTDGPSEIPAVKPLVRRKGFTYPVLLDAEQKVVKLYNPRLILPYTAVIDLGGRVVHTHLGYNSGDELKLKEEILKLLPGESEGAAGDTTSAEGEDDRG